MLDPKTEEIVNHAAAISKLRDYTGSYKALGGGEINETFLLECKTEKVILRIAKHTNQHTLHQEADVLSMLDLPSAPKLIYFSNNSKLNGRQWIIEGYIAGNRVDRLNQEQFKNFGKLLAKVHRVKSGKVGVNIKHCFLDACKMFGHEKYLINHPSDDLRRLIIKGLYYFHQKQSLFDSVQACLIHGDATPSNILVSGDRVALIDWELSKFKDPMAEFSTVFYEDMEYNQGKWRIKITSEEKRALFDGYLSEGGIINEDRLKLWMNLDKLGAAVFLYWRIHQSGREATHEQIEQYHKDLGNLIDSLDKNLN